MAIKPWLCFAAVLCPLPWSFSAISQADRDARIHGHFPDVDVLRVDWRTRPLAAQIPVPWLARKVHNWSARKIVAKKKDLPSSRDFYKSSIHLTLLQKGFLEYRWVIQKCVPGAAHVAIKRPKLRLLRILLRLFMRDSAHTQLECGFQSAGRLKVSSKLPKNPGELRRSLPVYAPYSSFQVILQKWEQQNHTEKDFRKANEFARECLLWCAEQPQRL